MTRSALLACLLCGLAAPAVLAQQGSESEPEPPQAPAEDAAPDRDRDQDRSDSDRAEDRGSARPRSLLRLGPFLDPEALDRPSAETLVGAQGPKDATPDAETAPFDPAAGVEVGALDRLGLEGIGTLGPQDALPPDLWHGSDPEVAAALLAALPHRLRSQGVRHLWRQLLLSPALSPAAGRIPDGLRLRLEKLTAAGRVDDVLALSDAIPPGAMTADLAHLRADALLVGGRLDDGCALARDAARETGEARWLKMLALCEALAGNRSAAYLQISLLEESGEAGRLFPALIDRLLARGEGLDVNTGPETGLGTGLALDTVERVDPILYAAFLAADVAPPAEAARAAPPLVLGELAVNALMAPPARLAVAEQAARMGLIGGGRLAALFDAMAFTDADLGTADAVLDDPAAINGLGSPENPPLDGMMIDALLFAKARRAQDPTTRLAFLDLLFDRAVTRGYAQVMAVAVAPLLDTVMPTDDLVGHAGLVGRVHLITGQMDAARRWYAKAAAMATAPGRSDDSRAAAGHALRALTPLMLIAEGPAMADYDAALARWAEDSAVHAPERLQAGLVLLDALDGRVPAAAWSRALQAAAAAGPGGEAPVYAAPNPAVWRQLLIAAGTDRLGETVAAALALVGDAGATRTDPAALSAAVGALADAGFEAAARRLAFEALIAGAR